MFEYAKKIISEIECEPSVTTRESALHHLRSLGLADFGLLSISLPNPSYPKLSKLLPVMASAEVQKSWTGADGETLLAQTCAFVRNLISNFILHTGLDPASSSILDYGCGYGRIMRIMNYFVPEAKLFGVDPWDESINLCTACGIGNVYQSDYLPKDLPIGSDIKFDLIYAFSVFTHTSERATRAALKVLRDRISDKGILAITLRPIEIWDHQRGVGWMQKRKAKADHRKDGFAFVPHNRDPVDGDITYGDTSIDPEWLTRKFADWRIVGIDRALNDGMQLCVFLMPS